MWLHWWRLRRAIVTRVTSVQDTMGMTVAVGLSKSILARNIAKLVLLVQKSIYSG